MSSWKQRLRVILCLPAFAITLMLFGALSLLYFLAGDSMGGKEAEVKRREEYLYPEFLRGTEKEN